MTQKKESQSSKKGKFKYYSEFLASVSSIIAGVIANLSFVGIKKGDPLYFSIVIGSVLILAIMIYIVQNFRNGPSKVAEIKNLLVSAYSNALDSSRLNPNSLK